MAGWRDACRVRSLVEAWHHRGILYIERVGTAFRFWMDGPAEAHNFLDPENPGDHLPGDGVGQGKRSARVGQVIRKLRVRSGSRSLQTGVESHPGEDGFQRFMKEYQERLKKRVRPSSEQPGAPARSKSAKARPDPSLGR